MRVLVDIVHPADVLFFRRPMEKLRAAGAEIRIASRDKDIAPDLLDRLGLAHEIASRAATGRPGRAAELIARDWRVWRLARQFRPHVMTGFGGVAIAHAGALLGIPSVSFYDCDHARLQIALTVPLISQWHVPQSWRGREAGGGRTRRFNSYKELSYLHPDEFTPDPAVARAAGWDPERPNVFIRLISWEAAAHDIGRAGPGLDFWTRQVEALRGRGWRVHISAEGPLPARFEPLRYRGPLDEVHHLMAQCRLFLGESNTMAAESCFLGVPAVLCEHQTPGCVADLAEAGLVRRELAPDRVAAAIAEMSAPPPEQWRARRDAFLADKENMADYVTRALLAHAPAPAGHAASAAPSPGPSSTRAP